ncbi:hypothetical protein BH23VER1_BH23VER1_20850 [soil metagenome]
MKPPPFRLALGLFLAFGSAQGHAADPPDLKPLEIKLSSLRSDLEAEEAQDAYAARAIDAVLATLAKLKVSMDAARPDLVRELSRTISAQALPPEIATEVQSALVLIDAYLDATLEESAAAYRQQIDGLVGRTAMVCREAESSGPLELLLVEMATLDPGPDRSEAIGTRYTEKMAGITETALGWARYLDFKRAGNTRAANNELNRLSASTKFPILTREEIEGAIVEIPPGGIEMAAMNAAFQKLETLDDIPSAIAAVRAAQKTGGGANDSSLHALAEQLTDLHRGWEKLQAGDSQPAYDALRRPRSYQTSVSAQMDELHQMLAREYLARYDFGTIEMVPEEGESAYRFLQRIYEHAMRQKDYSAAMSVSALSQVIRAREPSSALEQADVRALSAFLAARKLEDAGDDLAALIRYRHCVADTAAKLAPVEEAQEGIRRIGERHPELLNSPDSLVLEKLEQIEDRLNVLRRDPRAGFR